MPKLIDHTERKKVISQAVWKLLIEQGISAITIRNVAAEAELSTGSLRHSFDSRVELVTYALDLIGKEAESNLRSIPFNQQNPLDIVRALEIFIPLTSRTQAMASITLGMIAELKSTPEIKEVAASYYRRIRSLIYDLLLRLQEAGHLQEGINLNSQANYLTTLCYGLSTTYIIGGPGTEPQALSRIFRRSMNKILVHPVPYLQAEDCEQTPAQQG